MDYLSSQAMIAHSRALAEVGTLIRKVAPSSCTVLITGESGTGKELAARAIHEISPRASQAFVPLNVAAVPGELMESCLFGHCRGAFTGASESRDGVFRTASNGTLLLDEIGELPLHLQPKLLRALEEKEVLPVGSDRPVAVRTRVIAATSRDLEHMASEGGFRRDLLYRLNTVGIRIPPLREHPEDIPALAEHFCRKYCSEHERPPLSIDPETLQLLIHFAWPGNIRELAHVIERAALLCESPVITPDDLPPDIRGVCTRSTMTLDEAVDSCKRMHIVAALETSNGNRATAARLLDISEATLFRYIQRFGLKGFPYRARRRPDSQ